MSGAEPIALAALMPELVAGTAAATTAAGAYGLPTAAGIAATEAGIGLGAGGMMAGLPTAAGIGAAEAGMGLGAAGMGGWPTAEGIAATEAGIGMGAGGMSGNPLAGLLGKVPLTKIGTGLLSQGLLQSSQPTPMMPRPQPQQQEPVPTPTAGMGGPPQGQMPQGQMPQGPMPGPGGGLLGMGMGPSDELEKRRQMLLMQQYGGQQ